MNMNDSTDVKTTKDTFGSAKLGLRLDDERVNGVNPHKSWLVWLPQGPECEFKFRFSCHTSNKE